MLHFKYPISKYLFIVLLALAFFPVSDIHAQDITSGLVAHYTFDETSGTTATDSSGNNNTGTLTNGPTWTAGKIGNAINFDGVDDYVSTNLGTIVTQYEYTWSAWIHPNQITASGLVAFGSSAGGNFIDGLTINGSGKIILYQDGSVLTSNATVNTGSWYHIVGTMSDSANAAKIYINGSLDVSGVDAGWDAEGCTLFIGAQDSGSGCSSSLAEFKGLIDDVRVYNRALTPVDISALYAYTGGPPDIQAPTQPTNLQAIAVSSSQINLSWTASTDNVGVTGYRVYRGGTQIATPSTNSYSDTGLFPSTTYSYTVAAVDGAGNVSSQSTTVQATTLAPPPPDTTSPSVPTNLTPTAQSSSQINLSWTASTDNVGVTGYRVERCQGASCTNFAQVGTPTGTTYNDTGLTANTTYRYQVRATDAVGNLSGYSSIVSATTQTAPTGGSVLGNLVASMQPGMWTQLPDSSMLNFQSIENLGYITGYGDSALWDSIAKQFRWVGSEHNNTARHVVYNDATNTWLQEPIPTNPVPGHAYDHNAINVNGRTTYFRGYIGGGGSASAPGRIINKYNLTTQTWTNLPANTLTPYSTDGIGLSYFPEMNGLVGYWCGENGNTGGLYFFNGFSWSMLGNGFVTGTYHCFAEYSPVFKTIIFGGGNGSRDILRLDQNGTITDLGNAPFDLGVQWGSLVTVDPVTGLYLVVFANGSFYTFHPITNTWTAVTGANPPVLPGNAVCASVTTYGVVMCYKQPQGGTSDVWLYKHAAGTPPPSDMQAPSQPANVAAAAVSSSQINLSWTASTDNIGVTGYRVERCQGSTCTNFSQIATPTGTTYNDTGLTANTTYRYQVRAADDAGNLSSYSSIVSATTQSSGGTSADADFLARCSAPGVTLCVGFDRSSEIDPFLPNYDCNGVRRALLDTSVQASGAASLRFEIPANADCANTSGQWVHDFGANFGQNSTFYVQFRQRFDDVMASHNFGGNGWKQAVFYMPPTGCASIELTTQNTWNRGFPQMYTDCGGRALNIDVGADILLQQGDYNCRYSTQNPTDCSYYRSNQWMTFYYKAHIGNWGQPNSDVEAWVAYEGQPLKKFIDIHNFRLDYNNSPSDVYNTVSLLPYNTRKTATGNPNPQAFTWYDELIISRNKIADPGSTTPPPTLVGDLNQDRTVNSFDWSIMASVWFTADAIADLNSDGIVNSIDFSLMNANWGRSI